MESQFRTYTGIRSSTQVSKKPIRLYVGTVYLVVGLIIYLFAN